MDNFRAIPEGYMTVGQLAKKIGTTVRTLQYYDKEGLLNPSAESEGGRRLYTDKDLIQLYQILTLKSLGFSLDHIKNHLIPLDTPEGVAEVLTNQAEDIKEKITNLTNSLQELQTLKEEVLKMKTVDFKKYADIIVNLQMKNQFYRLIKHFDDKTLDNFRGRFDKETSERFIERCTAQFAKATEYKEKNICPDSKEAQVFAKEFWDMVMEFTGGDTNLLNDLMKTNESLDSSDEWNKSQQEANEFIGAVLDVYFTRLQTNPLENIEQTEK